jgi:hypothetical protein
MGVMGRCIGSACGGLIGLGAMKATHDAAFATVTSSVATRVLADRLDKWEERLHQHNTGPHPTKTVGTWDQETAAQQENSEANEITEREDTPGSTSSPEEVKEHETTASQGTTEASEQDPSRADGDTGETETEAEDEDYGYGY